MLIARRGPGVHPSTVSHLRRSDEQVRLSLRSGRTADGMNLRRIARTLKVTHPTVANWVNARAAQLPDTPPQPANADAVHELDELFTFVGSKKAKSTS